MRTPNPRMQALRDLVKRFENADFFVHVSACKEQSWGKTYEAAIRLTAKENDTRHVIDLKGQIIWGNTSHTELVKSKYDDYCKYVDSYLPDHGFWSLPKEHFVSAVASMPIDCEPIITVYLDSHTNQNLVDKGFHGDSIRLVATIARGKRTVIQSFLLDVSCGPHNLARFGVASQ